MRGPFTASFATSFDAAMTEAETLLRQCDAAAAADLSRDCRERDVTAVPMVAVVGEAKRGKSTLVNRLLGVDELSPVGVLETTAAPIHFRYGDAERCTVQLTGSETADEVPLAELATWTTLAGAEAASRVPTRCAEVHLPSALLRDLSLLDTPGLGGLSPEVGRLTRETFARSAALVFVLEAHTEVTSHELAHLAAAAELVETVLVVVTAAGDLSADDLDAVVAADRERITAAVPRLAHVSFFPVDDVTARQGRGTPAWDDSGMAAFEKALLAVCSNRGWSLHALSCLRLTASALEDAASVLTERIESLSDPTRLAGLEQERDRLTAARRTLGRVTRSELSVSVNNARLEVNQHLTRAFRDLEEQYRDAVMARHVDPKRLPELVAADLELVALELSEFLGRLADRLVGDRVNDLLTPEDRAQIARHLEQQLAADVAMRSFEGGHLDLPMLGAMSLGLGVTTGRVGLTTLGPLAAMAVGVPVVGQVVAVGLGGAVALSLLRLRVASSRRSEALGWVARSLPDVRNELSVAAIARLNELQASISLMLEDALDERMESLTRQIQQIERDRKDAAHAPTALRSVLSNVTATREELLLLGEGLRRPTTEPHSRTEHLS